MGVTTKKYRVLVCFCRKLTIFTKTVGTPIDFWQKFENFETHKNTYTGQLCITSP
jgi:hypothetical protein